MTENLVQVESAEHFKNLLSKDLDRVALLNFWTPWAEPCKTMNHVVAELAKRYPAALVLQIEAESLSDIAESFDIEAVPSFLILRGHTLLSRISGADAKSLTVAMEKHAASPPYKPQSQTSLPPAAPSNSIPPSGATESAETQEQLETRLIGLMNQSQVVLFMKGTPDAPRCGFSRKIVGVLNEQNVAFSHFDILTDESVRQGLKKLNDWPTFPQLIVKGAFVGGLDIVKEMVDNGELKEILA
ncbi:hypothetical protein M378DRAFT_132009 [Amanita muscaria Koide BX008]|uniref:Thioredoxin domain-containing protein n=1 Tax=Amanita muscaria (strain Koide BX008) TaxID=946122 RepID=A0A0C2WRJ0_AMAMK|nr:hypothetical protein M378DRAFT_132009 [Amanita muscaria Koide BX008]